MDDGESASATDRASSVEPLVKRASDVTYRAVDAAEGMSKGVLIGESEGAPHFAIRQFVLEPGASVPRHTNDVEHEQYVLSGSYTVGIEGEEYEVEAGDSLLIPAGAVHWYRNDADEEGAFLCAVPNGDDAIRVVDGE